MLPLLALLLWALALLSCSVSLTQAAYNLTRLITRPDGVDYFLSLSSPSSPYGHDIAQLRASIYNENAYRVRLVITDANAERWSVPDWLRPPSASSLREASLYPSRSPAPIDPRGPLPGSSDYMYYRLNTPPSSAAASEPLFEVQLNYDPSWGIVLKRSSSSAPLFDLSSLVFSNQFIELNASLANSSFLFGLGQRDAPFHLRPNSYTFWNADNFTQNQINSYGSHPAYWAIEQDNNVHATIMYNSHQMEVVLGVDVISYRMTGGIIDLTWVLGPTPEAVAAQYTEVVGKPYMPPAWALGFQTCRWGISDLDFSQQMLDAYRSNGFPLDVFYHDIDYLSYYFDFTFDIDRFPASKLAQFNQYLARNNQHHVYIVDPGIPALVRGATRENNSYYAFQRGVDLDVYIRHPAQDAYLYACVWPSFSVVFGDFSHANSFQWWYDIIQDWAVKSNVGLPAGLWLDMNEVSSFVAGQIPFDNRTCANFTFDGPTWSTIALSDVKPTPSPAAVGHAPVSSPTDIATPPYLPGGVDPNTKSINVSSHLAAGQFDSMHNLYGQIEQRISKMVMERLQADSTSAARPTRSFTLSRASFLGSGHYGAVWTGDHDGTFEALRAQLPLHLQFGLHGISMIGSDLCGLADLTKGFEAENCARWIQFGSVTPLMRLHYQDFNESHHREPYSWPEPAPTLMRQAMLTRYQMMPYLYGLAIWSHLSGSPIYRPMFYEFVADNATWALETQAMLGPSLLVAPAYQQGATSVSVYLPLGQSRWFDYHTGELLVASPGSTVQVAALYASNGTTPILLRGGHIVPQQRPLLTVTDTLQTDYTLVVALDDHFKASGHLLIDDGLALNNVAQGNYHRLVFNASFYHNMSTNTMQGEFNMTGFNSSITALDISMMRVERIVFLGLDAPSLAALGNVTIGGGAAGDACVSMPQSFMSLTSTSLTITFINSSANPNASLLAPILTDAWTFSFNKGCIVPDDMQTPPQNDSLLLPLAVLGAFFVLVLAGLMYSRTSGHTTPPEPVASQAYDPERPTSPPRHTGPRSAKRRRNDHTLNQNLLSATSDSQDDI